jgi:hypothetical protein
MPVCALGSTRGRRLKRPGRGVEARLLERNEIRQRQEVGHLQRMHGRAWAQTLVLERDVERGTRRSGPASPTTQTPEPKSWGSCVGAGSASPST